jgi:ATP-binding cassette, subfamily C, bacterial
VINSSASPLIRPVRLLRTYLASLRQFAGDRRLAGIAALVLAGALLEGVGLAMLVPLLGWLAGTDAGHAQWLAALGVQPNLPGLLLAFVGLIVLRAGVTRQRDVALLRLRLGFVDSMREQLQAGLAAAPWRFLSRVQHADVLHVLVADLNRVSQGTYFLLLGVSSLAMGLAGLGVAFWISPKLTLVAMVLAGLLAMGLRQQLRKALTLGADLSQAQRFFFAAATDFLGGLKLIKASGAEARHVAEFAHQAQALSDKQIDFTRSQGNARALFEVGAGLLLAGLLYGAFTWLHMGIAELLIVVLVFARLLPLVKEWNNQVQQLLHMLPAFHNARRWQRRCRRVAERQPAAVPALSLTQALTFSDVGYRHNRHAQALSGLHLSLPAYQTTALVGPSGAGKTTLADLVLGLLAPSVGRIEVDGHDLGAQQLAVWRRSVGYVAQDAFLFPESIRRNLLWFKPTADEAALWAALDQAAAGDFVRALPQGLDTLVGERGIQLSGGERQRLALARALLGEPQLLVLDEATSHLDAANERRIQEALAAMHGRLTILVIAHRLTTVRHADQILVLEQGRIVQRGNWQSLAEQEGLFQRLLRASH